MRQLGEKYEHLATRWIQARGLRVLARNFSCKAGEIDIIAMDRQTLVFIEVRARSNVRFASAAASVDYRKQQTLRRTALHYLQFTHGTTNVPCRFDVIAIEPRQSLAEPAVRWIRSAF